MDNFFNSRLVAVTGVGVAFIVLVGLGAWQLDRLAEKRLLIDSRQQRMNAPLKSVEQRVSTGEIDEWSASASGRWISGIETHLFATRNGVVGWQIVAPMRLDSGSVLFIDRGFVAERFKAIATRPGPPGGRVEITGALQSLRTQPPDPYVPTNDIGNNIHYWLDSRHLRSLLPDRNMLDVVLIADPASTTPGGPEGRSLPLPDPANHLSYAVTWFGLALVLIVIAGLRLRAGRNP